MGLSFTLSVYLFLPLSLFFLKKKRKKEQHRRTRSQSCCLTIQQYFLPPSVSINALKLLLKINKKKTCTIQCREKQLFLFFSVPDFIQRAQRHFVRQTFYWDSWIPPTGFGQTEGQTFPPSRASSLCLFRLRWPTVATARRGAECQ